MGRKYFHTKEINEINKNNMVVTYYEEFYKPESRHGIPDAIIIDQSNVLRISQKDVEYKKFRRVKVQCPYCKRKVRRDYLKTHHENMHKNQLKQEEEEEPIPEKPIPEKPKKILVTFD